MRVLEPTSEAQMVALFLQAEIQSTRWRDTILQLLQQQGWHRSLVDTPDARSEKENIQRAKLLGDFRGWKQNRDLFENWPTNGSVRWFQVLLGADDLARVRYIDYSYWNELSSDTRLVTVAAQNIRAGVTSCGVPNDGFWSAVRALKEGTTFPDLILIGASEAVLDTEPFTLLEGHVRATAYLLSEQPVAHVSALLGIHPDFVHW